MSGFGGSGFRGLTALTAILLASPAYAAALRIVEGRPVVKGVFVNGHGPYSFLLDTGTTANHLDRKLAESIGLKATFRGELISAAGTTYVPGAEGIEVALDSVRAEGQRFLFAGIDMLHQLAPDIQGILGESFLSHFDYRLDMRAKRVDFGARLPGSEEVRAPLRLSESRPMISTSLGSLVLDSGTAWVTLFGLEGAGTAGTDTAGVMTTLSGSLRVSTVARKLLIEGHAFWRGPALAVPHTAETGAQGLLPVSVFKSVYFSNSERYVSFEER